MRSRPSRRRFLNRTPVRFDVARARGPVAHEPDVEVEARRQMERPAHRGVDPVVIAEGAAPSRVSRTTFDAPRCALPTAAHIVASYADSRINEANDRQGSRGMSL